jgi:hypothetical protein
VEVQVSSPIDELIKEARNIAGTSDEGPTSWPGDMIRALADALEKQQAALADFGERYMAEVRENGRLQERLKVAEAVIDAMTDENGSERMYRALEEWKRVRSGEGGG